VDIKTSSFHQNVTYLQHDKAEKLLFGIKQQLIIPVRNPI
jgi:hypothetical protein